jgi:hypothetical protein
MVLATELQVRRNIFKAGLAHAVTGLSKQSTQVNQSPYVIFFLIIIHKIFLKRRKFFYYIYKSSE